MVNIGKPLPIGVDNFKEIIERKYYYIDKTLLIKELLDSEAKVSLFTRPRRFGKTLAQSMIRYYFEKATDMQGNIIDNRDLFAEMKIMQTGKKYTDKMGQYPVINLVLKSAKQPSFHSAFVHVRRALAKEFGRHKEVLQGDFLSKAEKLRYNNIKDEIAEYDDVSDAIQFLSECLFKYYNTKVIILIDEYDVPLENAYYKGFYGEMIDFIRSLFESALKTNEYLEFAVITGCLRISRESIFTGLNNLEVISILNNDYGEHFGFTQSEVTDMLKYYNLDTQQEIVKKWYNGYLFGDTQVYNPWSLINYVKSVAKEGKLHPRAYWSNTSSNSIVKDLIRRADFTVREELEELLQGKTIEKPIHEDITYEDIYTSQENLWNFLFFTGYLKKVSERFEERKEWVSLAIPNEEVACIYENKILEWFEETVQNTDFHLLYEAILNQDCDSITEILSEQMEATISFYDYAENYYHGFMAGLLKNFSKYRVLSNRESGTERSDVILKPGTIRKPIIIMEFKITKDVNKMKQCCQEALHQIEEKNYQAEFEKDGYHQFIKYGICFCRKDCLVLK